MTQVNGFQPPGLAFSRPAGGLKGFQRQGMDQRKKSLGAPFQLTKFASAGDIVAGASGLAVTNLSGSLQLAAVAASPGRSTGRLYFECVNLNGFTQGAPAGVGTASARRSGATGSTTNVVGAASCSGADTSGGGSVYVDGVYQGFALNGSGIYLAVAVNIDTGKVWFKILAGGDWNSDPTADPTRGIGGLPLPVTGLAVDGMYYILAGALDGNGNVVNVGPLPGERATFQGSIPDSFFAWQGV